MLKVVQISTFNTSYSFIELDWQYGNSFRSNYGYLHITSTVSKVFHLLHYQKTQHSQVNQPTFQKLSQILIRKKNYVQWPNRFNISNCSSRVCELHFQRANPPKPGHQTKKLKQLYRQKSKRQLKSKLCDRKRENRYTPRNKIKSVWETSNFKILT